MLKHDRANYQYVPTTKDSHFEDILFANKANGCTIKKSKKDPKEVMKAHFGRSPYIDILTTR